MKELTLKQAAEDCRGTLTPEQAEGMITGVQIDSRRAKARRPLRRHQG